MDVKANGLNTALKDKKISLAKVTADKNNFEANKEKCLKEISELKNTLTSTNDRLLYIIKMGEDVTKHQETVAKMVTLVKRDFRGILLSSIIGYINQKCKSYAKDIFGTDDGLVVPVFEIDSAEKLIKAYEDFSRKKEIYRKQLEKIMPSYIEKARSSINELFRI